VIKKIDVRTKGRDDLVDITRQVEDALRETGIKDGLCVVYIPHTTAGVTINENADPSVGRDLLMAMARAVPDSLPFTHGEGNSRAHVKASLIGSSASVFVEDGRLRLGTWQGIYLCEFDGPRERRVLVQVIPA